MKWIVSKINENITEIEWLQNSMLSSNNGQKSSTLEELICQTSEMNKKARDRIKGNVNVLCLYKLIRSPLF